jgi:hypothetical protein
MARNAMTVDDKEALADAAGQFSRSRQCRSVLPFAPTKRLVSDGAVTMSKIQRRTMPRAMVAAVTGTDVTPLSSQAANAAFTPLARGRRHQKYMRPMKEAGFSADKLFWPRFLTRKWSFALKIACASTSPPMAVNGSSLPAMPLRTVRVQ